MEENFNVEQNNTVNEPNIPNNKGSNKGLLIVICLLILVIAGLLVYLFVIKGEDKDNNGSSNNNGNNNVETNTNTNNNDNNNSNNADKNENRELTDKEINDLLSMIDTYALDKLATNVNGRITGVNNRLLLNSIYSKFLNNSDEYVSTYKTDDVKNYFKNAFNITISEYPDIICPLDNEVMYKYIASDNVYKFSEDHPGHGGEVNPTNDAHYIVKSNTDEDLYTIDIIFAYGSLIDGFYVNGKDLDLSLVGYTDGDTIEEIHDKVNKYFADHKTEYLDGDIYEYTFKKDNGKYYLYSLKTVSNN